MKATQNHTYTALAEICQQLKADMTKNIDILRQKRQELEIGATFYESIIKELKTTQENSSEKITVLRQAFHEDVDKYFDTIDERIQTACGTSLATVEGQTQAVVENMKASDDLTAKMDNFIAKNDSELLARGEQLLSKAQELSQSLAGSSIDAVEIPQVRLERAQDWGLEGAVDLQLQKVQHRPRVSATLIQNA